ncbi:MAG: acetyl-CoA C-acyltransferase [Albidovulum sp.]|nr:acetyl-CoA C-acyltransferase [Albidovulum sp.]MDE0307299.1 acetyl-CoA C-acyltransferase [Albidovulum sp.]MDE0530872.1 acetyl-CoA C-acyltransferase [Albidovulum sp.]
MERVVISSARRTPVGAFMGELVCLSAIELGGVALRAALADASFDIASCEELVMGCVLPAGLGQAPARQVGFAAGLAQSVPATTVNKMCGSGMKAIMLVHDRIALGHAAVAAAGGMESMSNAPYLLPKMRSGSRLGHSEAIDHMFLDGLEDAYESGRLMGEYAEDCANDYQFTREMQDEFAARSLTRARVARKSGSFSTEIVPVEINSKTGVKSVEHDEQPSKADISKIPRLKPAFRQGGTVTAANSSSISDGAAALVLALESIAQRNSMPILATIVGHASHAQAPAKFTTAPAAAARKLMDAIGWRTVDVELWEVNEAFAVVAMAFIRDLSLPKDIVNVRGGACALGHPIGASGARIVVTLLNAMIERDAKKGIAAICIGGGEATAVALERRR